MKNYYFLAIVGLIAGIALIVLFNAAFSYVDPLKTSLLILGIGLTLSSVFYLVAPES